MAQNITVTGNVKDASGEPVMDAGVMVAGTTQGTVTDFDGNYSISVPATASLVFSSIGFTDQNPGWEDSEASEWLMTGGVLPY